PSPRLPPTPTRTRWRSRPTSRPPSSPRRRAAPTAPREARSRRDVVEQLASVVGRERDVAGVEGDAVEVLVAQHVAVVQAVGEDPTEREAEIAQAVAVTLRARIGEREVDV